MEGGEKKNAIYTFDSFPPPPKHINPLPLGGVGGAEGVVLVLGPELLTPSSDNLEWPFLSRLAVVLATDLRRMPS